MPSKEDFFPSKYLKAEFLEQGDMTLTITGIKKEAMTAEDDGETKPVLSFQETDKMLALNITNWNVIEANLGKDYTKWAGNKITIYWAETSYKGDTVPCIRVRKNKPE